MQQIGIHFLNVQHKNLHYIFCFHILRDTPYMYGFYSLDVKLFSWQLQFVAYKYIFKQNTTVKLQFL